MAMENTFKDYVDSVRGKSYDELVAEVVNTRLNDWCRQFADRDEFDRRLPYIGWYWRDVDFANAHIPIGDCGSYIGFMVRNKWDYPTRLLDATEAAKVTDLVWDCMHSTGVTVFTSDTIKETDYCISVLWDYFQTLGV